MTAKSLVGIDSCAARFSAALSQAGSPADLTRVTPFERWDADGSCPTTPHRLGSRFGRFMDGIEEFDAAVFRITPSEASVLDPQQRLMLQVFMCMHHILGGALGPLLPVCFDSVLQKFLHFVFSVAKPPCAVLFYHPVE